MKIVVSNPYKKEQIIKCLSVFEKEGKLFWKKRNTIKIFTVGEEEWNIKSFKVPQIINKIVYKYFRKSKAQRSFTHAQILLEKGINTPKPIAFTQNSNAIGILNSYYISENLKYDFTFNELFDEHFPDRENILNQFTEFTYNLHNKNVHHFDHSRGNTLIVRKTNHKYDFYLIDLNRMIFEKMDFEKRIKNFNRLSLKPDMIKIISSKYASLIQADEKLVFEKMTYYCEEFVRKRKRKKRFKRKLGL